jgi:predicted N-acyltransferase
LSTSHPIDVQVVHSVQEIGREAWDVLGAGRPFASYRWYRFGERVLADSLPIYVILSQKGRPVARGTFWLTRQEPLPIDSIVMRRLAEALIRRWPLLICRAPLTDVSGLILPEVPLRDAALRTIIQVVHEQARAHRASFVLFDFLGHPEIQWAGWPEELITVQLSEPGTRLPIVWPDFNSYVKDLSKPVRGTYRRNCRQAADLGIVVKLHPSVTIDDTITSLIRNVERRHHVAPNPWVEAILENMDLVSATWLTAEVGSRRVGCGLFLGDADVRFLTLLGLDYEIKYVYFQMLYAAVRCAIEEKARVLYGGSGANDIKQRLGFQLEDNNYVAFSASNGTLRRLGRWLSASAS